MATARQIEPPADALISRRRRLFIGVAAALLASACAAIAFVFFLVRDHGHARVMFNEQSAPAHASRTPVLPPSAPPAMRPAAPQHSFSADRRRRVVLTGSVRLRVLRVDPANGLFDLSVTIGRFTHSHRHLKVNEPLWIALNRSTAIELLANNLNASGISGYWTETDRSGQRGK